MTEERKQYLVRILTGGILGLMIGLVLVPYVMYSRECPPLAVLACAALGAMAGLATHPFADSGRTLLIRSAMHYILTAAFFALLVVELDITLDWMGVLFWEGLLALLYLLIWLGRWIGWYVEVNCLRELLGLSPGPSPLKWRETLPYLPFVLVLCDVLPAAFRWIEQTMGADVPALSGLILPYLLLPVVSFCVGFSLGKRRGLCPLFPVACFLCYLPMVYLLFNDSALFHCFMTALPALLGNLGGWLWQRSKQKRL